MLYRISFETPEKAVLFAADLSSDDRERLEKVLAELQGRRKIMPNWAIEKDAPATYPDLYQWFDKEGFFTASDADASSSSGSDWPYDWKRPS